MPDDFEDLVARAGRLPAAVVSDVLRHAGAPHQVLHHAIAGIGPAGRTVVGPAFCVRGERVLGGGAKTNLRWEMYRRMPPGSVVLMASGGYEDAVVFGENVALALAVRGCRAIVTDGGIRDRAAMRELGMPVYARFVTPLSAGGQWLTTAVDEPVVLPGQSSAFVQVNPGDLIVADGDGVVVVPRHGFATVVEDAEFVVAAEERTRAEIKNGRDPEEAYASAARFGHVRRIAGPR